MMARGPSSTTTILVPCETFSVHVLTTPSERMTPLEQLVVRMLHSGLSTVDELDELLGMGKRPLMRLALDLLAQSVVTFNFATGDIRLVPSMAKSVEANKLDEVEGLERNSTPLMLMRDLVAGTVLVQRPIPSLRRGQKVPPVLSANSDATIPPEQLMRAVRGYVRRPRALGERPLHVLGVTVDRTYGGGSKGRLRDLEVEVRPQLDDATGRLSIWIESPDDLPWRTRTALQAKLTELANRPNPSELFKNLRNGAVPREEKPPPGLHEQVAEIMSLVQRLQSASRGTETVWQQNLESAAAAIEGTLAELGSLPVTHEFLHTRQRHVEVIREMIDGARRQVIIACPYVKLDAAKQFRDQIDRAVARGRQLFFLFGRDAKLEIERGIRNWLDGLQRDNEDSVFLSPLSARCNAKFVIADGTDLLVTGYSFMSQMAGSQLEAGLRLKASGLRPAEGEMLTASAIPQAADLLAIAKEVYPNHRQAVFVTEWPRTTSEPKDGGVAVPALPRRSDDPAAVFEEQRVALWKREWQRYAAGFAAAAEAQPAMYRIVRNADHRQLLFSALRASERRVLLVCEALTPQGFDRQLKRALESCLGREVQVRFAYGKADPAAATALKEIASTAKGAFGCFETDTPGQRPISGNLLICDDWAVVTSFNFLGWSHSYEGAERFSMQTEVGILIDGASVVEQIYDDLARAVPNIALARGKAETAAPEQIPSWQVEKPTTIPRRPLTTLLDQVAEAAGVEEPEEEKQRQIGDLVAQWFADARDATSAFAELEELVTIDVPFRDAAIAACLLRPDASEAMKTSWFVRLIEPRWWALRDLDGVVLLLGAAPLLEDFSVPPPSLALLAARVANGTAAVEIFEQAGLRDELDELGAIAIAALAIPAVLFEPTPPAEALRVVEEKLPAALRNWSSHARTLREQFPEGLREADFNSLAKVRTDRARGDQARQDLIMELRRCVGLKLNFTIGKLAWGELVNQPLGFQRLLEAAERGDVTVIRKFLEAHAGASVDEILDDVVRRITAVRSTRDDEIIGNRRKLCLSHLSRVVREARIWAQESDSNAGTSRMAAAVEQFGAVIAKEHAAITDLIARLKWERRYPAPLMDNLRAKFEPLIRTAKQ